MSIRPVRKHIKAQPQVEGAGVNLHRAFGSGRFLGASEPCRAPTEWVDPGPAPEPLDGHRTGLSAGTEADNRSLVLFGRGDHVTVRAGEEGIRFLLASGEPLREPVAWRAPIVMNTQEELRRAYQDLRDDTFLKHEST